MINSKKGILLFVGIETIILTAFSAFLTITFADTSKDFFLTFKNSSIYIIVMIIIVIILYLQVRFTVLESTPNINRGQRLTLAGFLILVITSFTILFYAYQKNKGIEPNVPTFAYVQTTTDTPKISQTTSKVNSTADTSKISQTTSEVNSTADAPKISQTTSEINSTTDTTLKPYIYSNEYIKIATLNSLNKSEIDSIINEIYARNGYIFSDSENNNNFLSKDWYKPNPNYTDDLLNDVEIGNIFIIEYYEFNKGYITNLKDPNYIKTANPVNDYNSSSDYKWNKEYIKVSFLKTLTEESAVKLRNEIYAWHGFIFQTKWISDYFNGQPWYIPNPNFKPEDLNEIENENIYIIRTHEKKMGWP